MTMKNKKILLNGIMLFIIILILLFFLNSYVIYGMENERFEIIKQIDYAKNIDILIIGNSHAQEGINAPLMSKMLNKNIYNFSFSQQESAAAYYFLQNTLKNHKPKTVIVEAYTLIQQVEGAYDLMPFSKRKIDYNNMLYGEADYVDVFFPITRLHNFWSNSDALTTLKNNFTIKSNPVKPIFIPKTMSFKAVDRHKKFNSDKKTIPLKKERLNNILEIKKLCDKNGIKLVVTMLPWYKTLVRKINYITRYYEPIKTFCTENNITYFDMNLESFKNWDYYYFREQDYSQNTHLNAYGQYEASSELSYFLDSIDDNITASNKNINMIKLKDYLKTIDKNNDILIIDDYTMPIHPEVYLSAEDEFKRLNITPSQEIGTDGKIIYISSGAQYTSYDYIDDIDYEENLVTILELDSNTSEVISRAVIHWNIFDTAFIR